MYLLDTNIVSELRRARPHPAVLDWIQDLPAHQLHVSAVTIGEIQAGIEITREQDPAKAGELEAWLGRLLTTYSVLPVDANTFKVWARLMHRKSDTLMLDALIASVAIVNRLTVVTRNVRDFQQLAVSILNPFDDSPTVHEGEGKWAG
ncbi:MAG: type II toxin-antitoxin system VapC family toxin [Deltaproteobacteria bacterium]|nr:type II toxin-antitoxin system VapC family toxin [Deltaproteobacteria bacterium]